MEKRKKRNWREDDNLQSLKIYEGAKNENMNRATEKDTGNMVQWMLKGRKIFESLKQFSCHIFKSEEEG